MEREEVASALMAGALSRARGKIVSKNEETEEKHCKSMSDGARVSSSESTFPPTTE